VRRIQLFYDKQPFKKLKIDDEDYEKCKGIKWQVRMERRVRGRKRWIAYFKSETSAVCPAHSYILDRPKGGKVYFRNGNPLDCRRANMALPGEGVGKSKGSGRKAKKPPTVAEVQMMLMEDNWGLDLEKSIFHRHLAPAKPAPVSTNKGLKIKQALEPIDLDALIEEANETQRPLRGRRG